MRESESERERKKERKRETERQRERKREEHTKALYMQTCTSMCVTVNCHFGTAVMID